MSFFFSFFFLNFEEGNQILNFVIIIFIVVGIFYVFFLQK